MGYMDCRDWLRWIWSTNSVDWIGICLFLRGPRQQFTHRKSMCRLDIDGLGRSAPSRYGNSIARRSSGGPIGVGGASVVPGLCWETRTSLYRLRWRRRVVPGSCLGRHQPRRGGRRRWRYSAKLRIQYRRTRLILFPHQLIPLSPLSSPFPASPVHLMRVLSFLFSRHSVFRSLVRRQRDARRV
jgi:hypothetical protein